MKLVDAGISGSDRSGGRSAISAVPTPPFYPYLLHNPPPPCSHPHQHRPQRPPPPPSQTGFGLSPFNSVTRVEIPQGQPSTRTRWASVSRRSSSSLPLSSSTWNSVYGVSPALETDGGGIEGRRTVGKRRARIVFRRGGRQDGWKQSSDIDEEGG